jgi:hypothetical protein
VSSHPSTLEARIGELTDQLAMRRRDYERVRGLTQSATYQHDLQTALATACQLVDAYAAGDSGEKAIYLLGRLKSVLAFLDADLTIVREYELLRERRRRLEEARPA